MPITLEAFRTNPHADKLHGEALNLLKTGSGQFDDALGLLGQGIELLHDDAHGLLQSMRMQRDHSFTLVRKGITNNSLADVKTGSKVLRTLLETHPVKIAEATAGAYSPSASQHLQAEVGATRTVLARTLDVKFVMITSDGAGANNRAIAREAGQQYRAAAAQTAEGNNRYYESSNSATFARHLRMMSEPGVRNNLRIAMSSAFTAIGSDRGNALAAWQTTVDKALACRTPEAARASILTRP